MKIVLATRNPGKFKEFLELAGPHDGIEFVLQPESANPIENGSTFIENAIIKARTSAVISKLPAVADDSGLEVDALESRPGINSARYCEGTDADRRAKLLSELEDVGDDNRGATFVCAMALCDPKGDVLHKTEGRWRGKIGRVEKGDNGFGYDALFYLPDRNLTVAEMESDEKNAISHRGQAWKKMVEFLTKHYFQP